MENNKKPLRVLELFAGIGAPRKALSRGGYNYTIVDTVEIDKNPVQSYNAIHNDNVVPQDISQWAKDVGKVDLIWNSSPCQDVSMAGKNQGAEEGSGTRSSLIYEVIRIANALKPKMMIWENVKGLTTSRHKHILDDYITKLEELGYKSYWKVLNAKDYGIPQNRERVFVVSILGEHVPFEFPEPRELTIKLKDILESNVDLKYYLDEDKVRRIAHWKSQGRPLAKVKGLNDISPTITARSQGDDHGQTILISDQENTINVEKIICEERTDEGLRFFKDNVCGTIRTINSGGDKRVLEMKQLSLFDDYDENGELKETIKEYRNYVSWQDPKGRINTQDHRAFKDETISGTVPAMERGVPKVLLNSVDFLNGDSCEISIRKLIPLECWRLMGFDDEDFYKAKATGMTDLQLYKQAGNSVVVNVIEAIFDKLLKDYQ